jgi:drug/metabolite transporter (DMT)-like permease
MALLYIGLGIVVAIVSFVDWAGRGSVARRLGAAPANNGQTFRGTLFALWAASLPLYFLWEWETHAAPPANEMATYQYGHKVISDAWTAITAFVGVLFAIRKP